MPKPNGRGGWGLTDDDVAEVMTASFGPPIQTRPTSHDDERAADAVLELQSGDGDSGRWRQ